MTHTLLLQLLVILVVARICGALLRRLGQPAVVGEMAAGFVPGPVVLGACVPRDDRLLRALQLRGGAGGGGAFGPGSPKGGGLAT